ncbi:MAG: DUF63 family protein [Halobacteriota archaeon]
MAILPEGFALPPLPHLAFLLVGLVVVAIGFARRRPPVTEQSIVALVPWMVAGSALHVLFVIDALATGLRPFAGTPAVYVTVAIVAGVVWLVADWSPVDTSRTMLTVGAFVALLPVGAAVAPGAAAGTLNVGWPLAGLALALLLGWVTWTLLERFVPEVRVTGTIGALAIFAHALDGVSTAVGVDVLGFGERTPLSRFIMEFAAGLPTASLLGVGWLFVLVKIVLISAVVFALAGYVREEPSEGRALLGLVAAVGLGPGVHNLLLFTVA